MGCGGWGCWRFLRALFDDGMPVPEKPGVYSIRYAPGGHPRPIPRVFRPDPKGILCYGRTYKEGLRRRLTDFCSAATWHSAGHVEGLRFHDLKYPLNRYPFGHLQVRWRECCSEDQTRNLETDLLDRYAKKLGEFPPLNRKRG